MWINAETQISQVSLALMQSLYSMYTLPVMLPDTHPPGPAPGNTLPLPVTPPSPSGSQVTGQLHPWGSSGWSQSASHTCQSESSLEKDQRFKKKVIPGCFRTTHLHSYASSFYLNTSSDSYNSTATFTICEDLHTATEHGLQHGVLLGQGLHGGVVQRSPDIQLYVFGTGTRPLEGGGPCCSCRHSRAHHTFSWHLFLKIRQGWEWMVMKDTQTNIQFLSGD